jgi:aminoglycoside phosphotransferase (APT) family kinase protein
VSNIKKAIQSMKLKVLKIDGVPESFSSEVCKLILENGEKVILKIPYNKNKLLKEYKMLQLLSGKLPVARVLDLWEGDDTIPGALLLSYIEGKPAIDGIDKRLAFEMGEFLAKLHEIKVDKSQLGDLDELMYTEKEDWWNTIRCWFENCIDDCKEALEPYMLTKAIKLFDDCYKKLPEPDYPSIVHMDYRPGNILVKDYKIMGVVDFESARIGSADIDFIKMKLYVWDRYKNTKDAFLQGYRGIRSLPDIQKTLRFYLLFNAFAGISWCVKRKKTNDSFCNENIAQLKEIINNKSK